MKISSGVWRGWEVHIEAGGASLPEYNIEQKPAKDGEPEAITLHVESAIGKSFKITTARPFGDYSDVQVAYKVDGRSLPGIAFRELVFGTLNLVEDEAQLPKEQLEALGTIKVTLSSGRLEMPRIAAPMEYDIKSMSVSEKSKKGMIGMTVAGGAATPAVPTTCYSFIRDPLTPEITITFSYRSRDLLMAQGIIPRPYRPTPSPTVDGEDRKPDLKRRRVKRESIGLSKATAIVLSDDEVENGHGKKRKSVLGTSQAAALVVKDDEPTRKESPEAIDLT